MSQPITAVAERGALKLFEQAEQMLKDAIAEKGPRAPFSFSNTVYYLPIALGLLATGVERLSDLEHVIKHAQSLADTDLASLVVAEAIESLRAADGSIQNPIDDTQVRGWGVQIADGRMPGVAVVLGSARNNAAAVHLVEELRRQNILCLLGGSSNGTGIPDQLKKEGVELGAHSCIVALGAHTTSAAHAFGFVTRCAMKLGGLKPGIWVEIVEFGRRRVPGFIVVLGEADEQTRAIALAAESFDFPTVFAGEADLDTEQAKELVRRGMKARGIQPKVFHVDLPIAYGPAFEEERIGEANTSMEFGGGGRHAYQLLQVARLDEVDDGKVEIVGTDSAVNDKRSQTDLGIVITVAGERGQADFAGYLERQIGPFLNYASGVQHNGSQDDISIRISNEAAAKGFPLEALGKILIKRFHEEFGNAIERVAVALVTDPKQYVEGLLKARAAYQLRATRAASLTDSEVSEFYSCARCRSFSPQDVCMISPERVSPCGQSNWLDAKAAYELQPGGLRKPIPLGKQIDARRGVWEGTNAYAKSASGGRIHQVAMYSIMKNPLSACGAFECIVMLIPEANGVMVVSQADTSRTPAGIKIETLASLTAGEQTPGVMGIGKSYLLSPKFISADGGFRRVVWMSSTLKEGMAHQLKAVCEREGATDLLDKIADEHQANSVGELVSWLKERDHPALKMEKLF